MNINCEIARDLLPLYKDGCLSASSEEALCEHLRTCPECRKYLCEYKQIWKAAKAEPREAPAGGYSELAKRLRRHRTLTKLGVGVMITALGAYAFFRTVRKSI